MPKRTGGLPFRSFSLLPGEINITNKLTENLNPSVLAVKDVSGNLCLFTQKGGCGSMYAIEISSESFKDLTLLQKHRLVQDVLKNEIKDMHGIQIKIV